MNDDDFEEFTEDPIRDTREDELIAAMHAYFVTDKDPIKVLQRVNDLAGKFHDLVVDLAEEFAIHEIR